METQIALLRTKIEQLLLKLAWWVNAENPKGPKPLYVDIRHLNDHPYMQSMLPLSSNAEQNLQATLAAAITELQPARDALNDLAEEVRKESPNYPRLRELAHNAKCVVDHIDDLKNPAARPPVRVFIRPDPVPPEAYFGLDKKKN